MPVRFPLARSFTWRWWPISFRSTATRIEHVGRWIGTAEEASKSTDTLAKKLKGLPTPLQDGAAGVQRLVAAGLGVGKATDVFLAFNNATLAAGTEAGAAQGAFQQLVQSISKGEIEGQEWNSLLAAMPTAFQGLAKSSGKTREELRELYRTDPQKLLDDLVNLNKNGGGGPWTSLKNKIAS